MKNKKNILIGGLIAVVLLLAVGYAAFATNLTINGTSKIDSKWDVHIKDNGITYTNAVAATSNSQQKVNDLTASFNCSLTEPGKSTIDYIVTVENTGTFGAQLTGITVTGATTYIGVSTSKSHLTTNSVIAAGGEDTVTVTVSYNDVENPPTLVADRTANITVTLNFVQANGAAATTTNNGGNSPTEVYSWNTNQITVGTSQLSDLQSTETDQAYYTSVADVVNASGYTFFNMYKVEGNTIIEGYSCQTFGIFDSPICMQGGEYQGHASYYNYNSSPGNYAKLVELNSNNTFKGANGDCLFDPDDSECDLGNSYVGAGSYGGVRSGDYNTTNCFVSDDGPASCGDE